MSYKSGHHQRQLYEAVPRGETGRYCDCTQNDVTYTYRVLALVSSRQGAKNVPDYMEDITPAEELSKLNVPRETIFVQRDRGMGRPTKRERREIDSLMDTLAYSDYEEE